MWLSIKDLWMSCWFGGGVANWFTTLHEGRSPQSHGLKQHHSKQTGSLKHIFYAISPQIYNFKMILLRELLVTLYFEENVPEQCCNLLCLFFSPWALVYYFFWISVWIKTPPVNIDFFDRNSCTGVGSKNDRLIQTHDATPIKWLMRALMATISECCFFTPYHKPAEMSTGVKLRHRWLSHKAAVMPQPEEELILQYVENNMYDTVDFGWSM